jgi:hypothetical protein
MRVIDVKKVPLTFFPPDAVPDEDVQRVDLSVCRWLTKTSKRGKTVSRWAKEIAGDEGIRSALLELLYWHNVEPRDVLRFVEELRAAYVAERELRAHIRKIGRTWKEVELLAIKARTASEPYLGELRPRALDVEIAARLLCRFFSTPRAKRPLETEIAHCKAEIKSFLRRRGVRGLNQFGWILLRAVFGDLWTASDGQHPIEAFRQIPRPFTGKIRTRADAERAIEKAKVDVFRMEQAARKE